jgi:hypothetical protein
MFALNILIVCAINWLTIYKFKKIIDYSKSKGKIQLPEQSSPNRRNKYQRNFIGDFPQSESQKQQSYEKLYLRFDPSEVRA